MSEKNSLLKLMQTLDRATSEAGDVDSPLVRKMREFAHNINQLHPSVHAWVTEDSRRQSGYLVLSPIFREQQHQPVLSFHSKRTEGKPEWTVGSKPYRTIPKLEKGLARIYQSSTFQNAIAYFSSLAEEPATGLLTGSIMSNALTVNDQVCEMDGSEFKKLASQQKNTTISVVVSMGPFPPGMTSHWETRPPTEPPVPFLRVLGHSLRISSFSQIGSEGYAPGTLVIELTGKVLEHARVLGAEPIAGTIETASATA